jgi:hypothetical protein
MGEHSFRPERVRAIIEDSRLHLCFGYELLLLHSLLLYNFTIQHDLTLPYFTVSISRGSSHLHFYVSLFL